MRSKSAWVTILKPVTVALRRCCGSSHVSIPESRSGRRRRMSSSPSVVNSTRCTAAETTSAKKAWRDGHLR